MGSRRTYSAEFKREAVALTREPGRTIAEVARSLGIDRSVLRAWKIHLEAEGAAAFPGVVARGPPRRSCSGCGASWRRRARSPTS